MTFFVYVERKNSTNANHDERFLFPSQSKRGLVKTQVLRIYKTVNESLSSIVFASFLFSHLPPLFSSLPHV